MHSYDHSSVREVSRRLADRYSYPPITPGESSGPCLPEDLRVERTIDFCDKEERLSLSRLCPPRSISVRLGDSTNKGIDFLCDCTDITVRPIAYRLHMYLNQTNIASFETKLERMQTWERAIVVFDDLMTIPADSSFEQIASGLNDFRLPRGELVIHSTGIVSLRELFQSFGAVPHIDPDNELMLLWDHFAELAREGEISNQWAIRKRAYGKLKV